MKDYSLYNIYSKERFTLYSKTRNKRFRFIRYTGTNYTDIVQYITELSPYTTVWEEKHLQIGTLYTYSGRTSLFEAVLPYNIRTIIASNPFLVTDSEEIIPLSLSNSEALEYIKMNKMNRVFCYEDILATFYFDPTLNSLFAIDKNHPKGISFSELPDGKEWFIAGFDKIHHLPYKINIRYQESLHIVDFQISFDIIVEGIEKVKYDINSLLHKQGKPIMFRPSWENYVRRKAMSESCLNEGSFSDFVLAIYKIIYEETKAGRETRSLLGTYAYDKFVKIVGELRHHYAHGNAEYEQGHSIPIGEIYLKYLKMEIGPQCPNDYVMMQHGILSDMKSFLITIYEKLLNSSTIIDTVNEDYFDNIYCGKALLPKNLNIYKGLKCCINIYTQNTDLDTKENYPFYCSRPEYIELKLEGIVQVSTDGTFYCKKYKLVNPLFHEEGKHIQISKIRPYTIHHDDNEFIGEIVECKFISNAISSMEESLFPEKLGITYTVEVDEEGRTHVDNILIGRKKKCASGDSIRFIKIGKNPAPNNPELVDRYPFVAIEIECIKGKNNPNKDVIIKKDHQLCDDMIDKEYTVDVDDSGVVHVGNIVIGKKHNCIKGDKIRILAIGKNAHPVGSKVYPYFAKKLEIIKTEEK